MNCKFEALLKSVEEHNYWAINQPDVKNITLNTYTLENMKTISTYILGGDNDNEDMFPKSISIMMQEHIIGHWNNYIAFTQILNKDEDDVIKSHYATLLGDGQRGHNNLPIGLSEAIFLINLDEEEEVFPQPIKSEIKQYMENITPLLERERKNTYILIQKYLGIGIVIPIHLMD